MPSCILQIRLNSDREKFKITRFSSPKKVFETCAISTCILFTYSVASGHSLLRKLMAPYILSLYKRLFAEANKRLASNEIVIWFLFSDLMIIRTCDRSFLAGHGWPHPCKQTNSFFSYWPLAVHHNFPFWRKNKRSFKRRPYTAAKSFLTTQCLRESSLCLLWVVKVSDACSKVRWIRAIPSSSLKNVSDNISGTVIFWISIWTRGNLIPLSLHISKYMLFSIIT